jgi:pyridoxamine 5'-phosphate oxidase
MPPNQEDFDRLRAELMAKGLHEDDLHTDPIVQASRWYAFAEEIGIHLPEAMTLATASTVGMPSARMVLLKGHDERGFVFFTNYDSRKGQELESNPNAALILYWKELDRQIRIEGRVEKVSAAESDAYFHSRPFASRVSASVSKQSSIVAGRHELEEQSRALAAKYPGEDIPRPPRWGGFRVVPTAIEIWQGRDNRLHDRFRYTRTAGEWRRDRLAP